MNRPPDVPLATLYSQLLLFGRLPISGWRHVKDTYTIPQDAMGYLGSHQSLLIERNPDNTLQVKDLQGHMLRRSLRGLSLHNAHITTSTWMPGVRRLYSTSQV